MMRSSLYSPPDMKVWQGRPDADREPQYIYQVVQPLDLSNPLKNITPGVAMLGFACDEGVKRNLGRQGAKDGPFYLKKALASGALHTHKKLYDAGSIMVPENHLEEGQQALKEAVAYLMAQGQFVLVFGGGHETAWGHYLGIEQHSNNQPIAIVNFDAHFDLRPLPDDGIGTSGTPFRQIADRRISRGLNFSYYCAGIQKFPTTKALFTTAKELGVEHLLASDIHEHPQKLAQFIDQIIAKNNPIYLSICLDVFAISHAPGVSAPQTLGLLPSEVLPALRKLSSYKHLIGVDIVELNPHYDTDHRTAKLGAEVASLFI